jgi:hypothetical protein
MSLVHWVECSRCQKWRIVPPMPDGSEEVIPDIWFCEYNRDSLHNTCEAPEEEYKPVPELPVVPLAPLPQLSNKQPKPAKINDPDSIRSRLKQLTNDDLQAAFESIDIQRLFYEEFGEHLASAMSLDLIPNVSDDISSQKAKGRPSRHQPVDYDSCVKEVISLLKSSERYIPENVKANLTRRFRI